MTISIKTFCIKYGWLIWALIVALMVLLFWFAFLSDSGLNSFFSSDALYLPSLYRDIVQDGYTFNGWTLNPAPNFFPDMLLFFILNAIFGDFITATFVFSVIQYFAIILMLYLIFKQVNPNSHLSTFSIAIFLFSSFLFLFFIDKMVWMSMLLNHNSFHNGAFIISLICIYLFLKYLDIKSWKILVSILLLSILSGASDRLFFISFSIPVFLVAVVLYFLNKDAKIAIKFIVALITSTIFAIAIWIWFKNNPYFSLTKAYGELTLPAIRSSWDIFTGQFYGYLTIPSFILILTYLSIFSYIGTVIYILKFFFKLIKEIKHADKMLVFQLFVLFFTPIVLLAPILSGSYGGFDTLRYNYFPYLLLPFNAVVLGSNWLNNKKTIRILLNTILLIFMMGFLILNYPIRELGTGLHRFFTFYPEKAQIIDSYFSDKDLKYGVTNEYWTAKQVTMFSKKGVRLYRVHALGVPSMHVSNKHWFIDHNKGRHAHCEFAFLLWSKDEEIPDIFKTLNEDINIQPIDLDKWYLYEVKPYRFIMPGTQFRVEPVLIDTSSGHKQ